MGSNATGLRLLLAAVLTPALALPAHHLGGAPTAGSLLVLLGTGLVVLAAGSLLRAGHGVTGIAGLLALGQTGAHLALGAEMGSARMGFGTVNHRATDHGMSVAGLLPSGPMLVAHVLAAVLVALLVVGADRVAPRCARLLRGLATGAPGFVPHTPSCTAVLITTSPAGLRPRVVTTQVLRRGPPVRV